MRLRGKSRVPLSELSAAGLQEENAELRRRLEAAEAELRWLRSEDGDGGTGLNLGVECENRPRTLE